MFIKISKYFKSATNVENGNKLTYLLKTNFAARRTTKWWLFAKGK